MKLPYTEEEAKEKVENIYRVYMCGVPQCIGAINGTYVDIKASNHNPTDYINRKNRYSLNLQVCCDLNYCFLDVVVSSVHDAGIPPCPRQIVDDTEPIPVFIMATLLTHCYHI